MKRYLFLSLIALLLATAAFGKVPLHKGTVRCEGTGIEGVVVTDGLQVVQTDRQGRFALPERKEARFIYLSTPAGYESPSEQGVVTFYLPVDASRKSYDFTLSRLSDTQTRHGFVVIADPQLHAEKEFALLDSAAQDIRRTTENHADIPFHGICVGDITSGDHGFYPRYNGIMETTGLQFRNCMGNHDMKIWGNSYESSLAPYEAMYGPCYYSYNVGAVHYVVLNDNFFIGRDWYYIGYLEELQQQWLARDLDFVPKGSTVVVALHIPTMYKDKETLPFSYATAGRSLSNHHALYGLLKEYNAHIVSGHMHTSTNSDIAPNLYEHNIAALSGAWWQGSLCTDGTPAGYAVFECDGDRISWYYKSTGYPDDFQLKLYDGGDDASFAGAIVANVWNSDPSWRIEMRADGGEPITLTQTTATDPQSRALYADPSTLDHKWISVVPSDHYYRAPLPAGTKQVEVSATDRFGRTYRAIKTIRQ